MHAVTVIPVTIKIQCIRRLEKVQKRHILIGRKSGDLPHNGAAGIEVRFVAIPVGRTDRAADEEQLCLILLAQINDFLQILPRNLLQRSVCIVAFKKLRRFGNRAGIQDPAQRIVLIVIVYKILCGDLLPAGMKGVERQIEFQSFRLRNQRLDHFVAITVIPRHPIGNVVYEIITSRQPSILCVGNLQNHQLRMIPGNGIL